MHLLLHRRRSWPLDLFGSTPYSGPADAPAVGKMISELLGFAARAMPTNHSVSPCGRVGILTNVIGSLSCPDIDVSSFAAGGRVAFSANQLLANHIFPAHRKPQQSMIASAEQGNHKDGTHYWPC